MPPTTNHRTRVHVLLLSNIFPTSVSPNGGTFITARIRALRNEGVRTTSVAIRPTHVGSARLLRTVLRRDSTSHPLGDFTDLPVPVGLRDLLSLRTFPSNQILESAADALEALTKDGDFDLVHAHGMYSIPAGAIAQRFARRRNLPFVITAHGSDINRRMPKASSAYSRILTSADKTIFVSSALRKRAIQLGADSTNSIVINNGVNLDVFSINDTPRERHLKQPLILFVGNLIVVKGADRLPPIFRAIRADIPNASFAVVGDGPLRSRLETEMADLPVEFAGAVPQAEVARHLASADLLVMPSRSEGYPCTILESYACGTPVIATSVGGVPEAIHNTNYLVNDSGSLPAQFASLARDVLHSPSPYEDLQSYARARSWTAIARQELSVYQDLVE
ncbi:glycosyltransferase [Georgenia sp. M64]|uniref:glycosyltransferase n=1 Tax=Georgenia sp. M64 TaxID=3120520 RepID=UPI0030E5C017